MARIRDYLQDDDKPFGVGRFLLDDGSEYFLDDAERARSFLDEVDRDSTNIAERGSADRKGETLSPADAYENAVAKLAGVTEPNQSFRGVERPDLMRRALAGPGTGEELESRADDRNQSLSPPAPSEVLESRPPTERGAEMGPPLAPPTPPTPEELERQALAQRAVRASQAVLPYKATAGVDPRRMQAEGVPVDKSITREGGLPAGEYERQSQDRMGAYLDESDILARHARENEARAALQVESLRKQAADAKAANDQREAEVKRVEGKYQEDRAWLDKETDSFFDKSKPDPDRLMKTRGVFGNVAVALAQFMGAYASVVSGSPNFAAQILDKKLDNDIASQMEEYKRGRAKLDSQLNRMAERGMTLEQMKAALKLQQERVVDTLAKAAARDEGTAESKQAYEALAAARQTRFIEAENKFRTEALGKTTVHADVVQPKAAGRVPLTPTEMLEQRGRYIKAENELGYQLGGGEHAEKAEERDLKRDEAGLKREESTERRRAEYGNKRGTIAASAAEAQGAWDTIQRIKEKHKGLPGVGILDLARNDKLRKGGSLAGSEYMQDAGELRNAVQILRDAAVRANAGTQTEGDVQRESEALAGEDMSEEQLLKGARRLVDRATTPLVELDATYSDVKERQDNERDRARYERYRKQQEDIERRRRGEVY